MLIKFYDTLPFEEGLYYVKSGHGLVQPCDLKWYTNHNNPFKYLGVKQHDGLSICANPFKDSKWSEKIEFDFS